MLLWAFAPPLLGSLATADKAIAMAFFGNFAYFGAHWWAGFPIFLMDILAIPECYETIIDWSSGAVAR
ncbi:MAG: hypothetical protein R2795_17650 [Saprospiraceae bacterium]